MTNHTWPTGTSFHPQQAPCFESGGASIVCISLTDSLIATVTDHACSWLNLILLTCSERGKTRDQILHLMRSVWLWQINKAASYSKLSPIGPWVSSSVVGPKELSHVRIEKHPVFANKKSTCSWVICFNPRNMRLLPPKKHQLGGIFTPS